MNKIDIRQEYKLFCKEKKIEYQSQTNVSPYDDTTLFCPCGMQQFKNEFKNKEIKNLTIANIQPCIRLNDIEEIGDGEHLLYFNMIGLFSFRNMSVKETIDFWMEFLEKRLKLKIDYVTVHPDKYNEWKEYYKEYDVKTKTDKECEWSDGDIKGYCTEFYINDIEIGNIVNPLGDCIDVGFGFERLNNLVNGQINKSKNKILGETIMKIIESGYKPNNLKQGYILRKLLRILYKNGEVLDHPFFKEEIERQENILNKYQKMKKKYKDKPKEWWYESHGIDIEEMKK